MVDLLRIIKATAVRFEKKCAKPSGKGE